MSVKEIAEQEGTTIDAVKSQGKRGTRRWWMVFWLSIDFLEMEVAGESPLATYKFQYIRLIIVSSAMIQTCIGHRSAFHKWKNIIQHSIDLV